MGPSIVNVGILRIEWVGYCRFSRRNVTGKVSTNGQGNKEGL